MANKAIRAIRKATKPPGSERQLALASGVSQPTINQLKNEKHGARRGTRKKLNRALGLVDGDWE